MLEHSEANKKSQQQHLKTSYIISFFTLELKEKFLRIEKEFGIKKEDVLTVSKLNDYIENKLMKDPNLIQIYVIGEASNVREYNSGHLYFDIKENNSLVSCIIFSDKKEYLKYIPENGKEVLVLASVQTYRREGKYQLNVSLVLPVGEGLIHYKLRILREKLEKEGLFKPEHKKPIPKLPRSVGIVTSLSGAVVRDIINNLTKRFPNIAIRIAPAIVQGDKAPSSIVNSIMLLNKVKDIDVIIVGRGGGSFEDLHCFNDENIARAIFQSKTPIISAVGHQKDYTICDDTADLIAITPTEAAKLAILDKNETMENINILKSQLEKVFQSYKTIKEQKSQIKRYKVVIAVIILLMLIYLLMRYVFNII